MNGGIKTSKNVRYKTVTSRFSSLLAAHSALITSFSPLFFRNPLFPASGSFNGLHPKRNFLAIRSFLQPVLFLVVLINLSAPIGQAAQEYSTDYEAAKLEAAKADKDIFLVVTASDWSEVSATLIREDLSQNNFKTAIGESFVLVHFEFLKGELSGMTPEIKAQNQGILDKFDVDSYPSVLLCDALGRPYAMSGYLMDRETSYIEHILDLRKIRMERDKNFEIAAETEGLSRAGVLISALESMSLKPEIIFQCYPDELQQIKESDPSDTLGYVRKLSVQKKISELQKNLKALAGEGRIPEILILVKQALEIEGLSAEQRQDLLSTRALMYVQQDRFVEGLQVIQEAINLNPNSESAELLDDFKSEILKTREEPFDANSPNSK